MIYNKYKNENKIAIIIFQSDSNYVKDIQKNHVIYSDKHCYNYYVFEKNNKTVYFQDIMKKHDYIMWIDSEVIFTNQNIKIEDKIIDDDKLFHINNDLSSEVIIIRNTEKSIELFTNFITNEKSIKDEYIHFYKENEIYSHYHNYTPCKYMLSFTNIDPKIDIQKQIYLFNNLLETEDKEPKIIISIATIPSRIYGLSQMVENLLSATIKPYKIVYTMPSKFKLFPDSTDHIERITNHLEQYIKQGIVYINEMEVDNENSFDYGPCNKWLGAYNYIEHDETLKDENYVVIILDDDLFYHKDIFEMLINKNITYNRDIISGYTNYSDHGNNIKITKPEYNKQILLLKGGNATLLPKHFFCNILNPGFKNTIDNGIINGSNDLVFQDDNIITTIIYYYKYVVKSIYNEIIESGRGTSYYYNNNNNDNNIDFQGVSGHNSNNWFDKSQTGIFLHNFKHYYIY